MGIEWVVAYLALGAVVGFIAGLLGVGGGGILVPMLSALFIAQGKPIDSIVHFSLGTSMACMIFTSFSSLKAHNRHGTVQWKIVRIMSIGIIMGTLLSTYVVAFVNALYLSIFFSFFMLYTAITMLRRNSKPTPNARLSEPKMVASGAGIGGLSALVSIGGGSLTVPFLVKNQIDIKTAIGTSAAIGFPISVAGTLGYVLSGWNAQAAMEYSIGFVYLPAVILVSIASYVCAPIGVKAGRRLKTDVLKKVFAFMLVVLSLKMLLLVLA